MRLKASAKTLVLIQSREVLEIGNPESVITMDSRRTTVAAAALFAAIFTLCAVSTANATDVVWKKAGNAM